MRETNKLNQKMTIYEKTNIHTTNKAGQIIMVSLNFGKKKCFTKKYSQSEPKF